MTYILVLISVQTVCKGYQQITRDAASRKKSVKDGTCIVNSKCHALDIEVVDVSEN